LLQGVLNTFVIFGSRVVGELVDKGLFRNERGRGIGYYATVLVLELVLGLLASMVVAWHSRRREFHADYGGAQLTSRANMQAALRRLASFSPQGLPGGLAAFGIAGGGKFSQLFSTHPPLAERIKVLGSYDLP
jgi:heat shock protein HtpX